MSTKSSSPKPQNSAPAEKELLIEVHSNFPGFSNEAIELVLEYASEAARLSYLLGRLKLPSSDNLEDQLRSLGQFAAKVGEEQFLMRARFELWKALQHAEKAKINRIHDTKGREQRPHYLTPSETPSVAPAPPIRGKRETPSRTTPKERPARGALVINVPGYRGPDRRSRMSDRRSFYDRRGNPAWIMRDKRHLSDRRTRPWGRRKTDREPLV